jgi:hypothetical protein
MKDLMLLALIAIAEGEQPIEHDITLLVGGFLVSGFVISHEKYLQHHQITKEIALAIEKLNAETPEPPEETRNFIHLRDAKFYLPGVKPIPDNMSVFVRIPLESVHGFSLGKLENSQT